EVLVSKLKELLVSCEGPLFLDEALSFNFTGNTYVRFVEAYVTEKLKNMIGSSKYIGIYPSGKHTRWLISLLEKNQLLNNIVFLDDKPESAVIPGKVHQITDYDTQLLDKVIFSIDTENPLLHQRAQELFGDKLEFLYQGLPAGPYILK
ncbi:MAG: hypothetical protein HRT88_09995, partial [Lentisphaeraceae bacterium]|nr:hypothetical protein [Lentisphaeraceae bacterium]